MISDTLKYDNLSICQFAQTATLPGNRYGLLFLKNLERAKAKALALGDYDYEAPIPITTAVKRVGMVASLRQPPDPYTLPTRTLPFLLMPASMARAVFALTQV